jgi:hypothetical protein
VVLVEFRVGNVACGDAIVVHAMQFGQLDVIIHAVNVM